MSIFQIFFPPSFEFIYRPTASDIFLFICKLFFFFYNSMGCGCLKWELIMKFNEHVPNQLIILVPPHTTKLYSKTFIKCKMILQHHLFFFFFFHLMMGHWEKSNSPKRRALFIFFYSYLFIYLFFFEHKDRTCKFIFLCIREIFS